VAERRECGKGCERRYGGVRGDVPPGLLAALPIVPSTQPTPKRPLRLAEAWDILDGPCKAGVVWLALNMIHQALLNE